MSAGQISFDIDARSPNERYADEYRQSLAQQARATGLKSARVGDPDGHDRAVRTIRELLREQPTITADDVQDATPIRSNAIGSAFAMLSRAGEIRVVGHTTAKRPEAHGRIVRIWGPP